MRRFLTLLLICCACGIDDCGDFLDCIGENTSLTNVFSGNELILPRFG